MDSMRAIALFISLSMLLVPFAYASPEGDPEPAEAHGQQHSKKLNVTDVLYSKTILPAALGYSTALRPPKSVDPVQLNERVKTLPKVTGLKVTGTLIGSDQKSAKNGVVRLGYLSDGRKVAVKTIMSQTSIEDMEDEAKGAFLLSEIGVFPQFHGIAEVDGHFSIVTDIVPGDVYIHPKSPSKKVLHQFSEIMKRFEAVGINGLPQKELFFQVMKSPEDDVLVIDADGFYDEFLRAHPSLVTRGLPNWRAEDPHEGYMLQREREAFRENLRKSIPSYSWGKQLSDITAVRLGVLQR
jgi:hypothetical protein